VAARHGACKHLVMGAPKHQMILELPTENLSVYTQVHLPMKCFYFPFLEYKIKGPQFTGGSLGARDRPIRKKITGVGI
jgi:hypothetical protein